MADVSPETQSVVAAAVAHAGVPAGSVPRTGRHRLLVPWLAIADGLSPVRIRHRDRLYRWFLALADIGATTIAMVVVVSLVGADSLTVSLPLVVLPVVLVNKIAGLYDRDELLLRRTTLDEAPKLLHVATTYAVLAWLLNGAVVDGGLGRTQILALWVAVFCCLVFARAVARRVARRLSPAEQVLFIGDLASAHRLRSKIESSGVKAQVVATLRSDDEHRFGASPLGGVLRQVVQDREIDRVVIAPAETNVEAQLELIRTVKALGVKVSILPRLFEVVGSSVVFDDLNGLTLLGVRRFGLTTSSRYLKRAVDFVFAVLLLIVLLPFFAILALAIRLDSAGPVLFRQRRVGQDSEEFEMLKFRTMHPLAEARRAALQSENDTSGLFKLLHDPRVTRVGRRLRAMSLDELPQLINVLRGEMSLVGPRPLVPDEDCQVEGWHRRRLHLTPGMTGPWQILESSRVPLQEMVVIDYLYVANWSFWNDLKILLRTVPHVMRSKGL